MRHHVHLDLTRPKTRDKVVGLRRVTLRERLARLILGTPEKFTVIVPGDSVDQVTITEKPNDEDLLALADAVGVRNTGGDLS